MAEKDIVELKVFGGTAEKISNMKFPLIQYTRKKNVEGRTVLTLFIRDNVINEGDNETNKD